MTTPFGYLLSGTWLTRPETIRYIIAATKELAEIMGIDLKEVGINA
jgi:hypothetical protein